MIDEEKAKLKAVDVDYCKGLINLLESELLEFSQFKQATLDITDIGKIFDVGDKDKLSEILVDYAAVMLVHINELIAGANKTLSSIQEYLVELEKV